MKTRLAVSLRASSVRRADKWVLRDISWQLRPGELPCGITHGLHLHKRPARIADSYSAT
jgi:hypothetical protein